MCVCVCVCVCVCLSVSHSFFIHVSLDGHMDYFCNLAVVHNAAINNGVYASLGICIFYALGKYLVVQLLGCRIVLFLTF